jgi:hypothetical protein
VWSNGYDMPMPVGVASTHKVSVFAWDDTRNADNGSHPVVRAEVGGVVGKVLGDRLRLLQSVHAVEAALRLGGRDGRRRGARRGT